MAREQIFRRQFERKRREGLRGMEVVRLRNLMSVAIVEMPEKMADNPADTYGRNCLRAC